MKILVADDDAAMRRLLLRLLARAGHQAEAAADGAELVRLWKRGGHALIFSDVDMPQKNGIEACAEIRDIDPSVRIVLMSGSPLSSSAAKAAGFGDCLDKPFPLDEILARLP